MLGSLSNLKEKKDFNDITSTSKLWIAQSCERDQVPVSSKFNDVLTILYMHATQCPRSLAVRTGAYTMYMGVFLTSIYVQA